MSVKAKLILGLIGFILIGCLVQQSIYTKRTQNTDTLENVPTEIDDFDTLEASVLNEALISEYFSV